MNAIARLTLACLIGLHATAADATASSYRFRLSVTTPLELANVPVDPVIDFGALLRDAKADGVVDLNSMEVIDLSTGRPVPHALEGFESGDRGRVAWLIVDPGHVKYEIRFRTADQRPAVVPSKRTPLIGTGDMLRYNAGVPRPITLFYGMGLVDLTGDGRRDLVGCWNYAYRPGRPWSGVICYPRVAAADNPGDDRRFEFGDLSQLRYRPAGDSGDPRYFAGIYRSADFADFNRDGHVDLVTTLSGRNSATFYLNTGRRDARGMPEFVESASVKVAGWLACRAVDLNGDGAIDLVVDGVYLKNKNSKGWPFQPSEPVTLSAGRQPCFLDVDEDGRLDAVCLQGGPTTQPEGYRIAWRRNLGGAPLKFGDETELPGVDEPWCSYVSVVRDGTQSRLLVQHDVFQHVSLFERVSRTGEMPRFARQGRAESVSAVLSLSDQAWPCVIDWDADGDLDLLVGGGYGWPRIVINEGTIAQPAYAEPRNILADGKPIRFLRNEILGEPPHWHNMGYSYPEFIDWDGDSLPDLIFPNETNRIFWYKNVGTKQQPQFGKRQQLLVDGFPDSPAARGESARVSVKDTYALQKNRPFFWRTAAAFADFNGDGRTDLITLSGDKRRAELFTQDRTPDGKRGLKRNGPVLLEDGRTIDDAIVGRKSHWTEAFRPIDFDGDGLVDLMYSLAGAHGGIQDDGSIYLLRNCGTTSAPKFEAPVTMRCFGEPIRVTNHGPCARPCDYDGDGKPDLVTCVEWSVYPFYRHAALIMNSRPKFQIGKLEDAPGR